MMCNNTASARIIALAVARREGPVSIFRFAIRWIYMRQCERNEWDSIGEQRLLVCRLCLIALSLFFVQRHRLSVCHSVELQVQQWCCTKGHRIAARRRRRRRRSNFVQRRSRRSSHVTGMSSASISERLDMSALAPPSRGSSTCYWPWALG